MSNNRSLRDLGTIRDLYDSEVKCSWWMRADLQNNQQDYNGIMTDEYTLFPHVYVDEKRFHKLCAPACVV